MYIVPCITIHRTASRDRTGIARIERGTLPRGFSDSFPYGPETEYTAPPRVRKEQKLRQDARRERISDLLKKYGMVRQNEGWRDNPKWKTKSKRKRQR